MWFDSWSEVLRVVAVGIASADADVDLDRGDAAAHDAPGVDRQTPQRKRRDRVAEDRNRYTRVHERSEEHA